MTIEVKVPVLPESIADATIATWHKKIGDRVSRDENILDLETDKVVLEVPAPADGVLTAQHFKVGDTVQTGQVLASLDNTASAAAPQVAPKTDVAEVKSDTLPSPVVRRLLAEHHVAPSAIQGTGKDGRLTKEDVLAFVAHHRTEPTKTSTPEAKIPVATMGAREERRVPMSRLRAKVAERLLKAQHESAMLTTFNEVNLKTVMDLRATYKDTFEKKYGIKLGFMSFFTKAVVESLKLFPNVNASLDGQDVVYHGYYDIGIAVSTERGLVVPVLRDADTLSLADIERKIQEAAIKAREGKLSMEDMQGGTFTITNGGVFGSLLSTPIINPPQTGILGMHKIEERPIAEKGQVVIRPMMYIALSYDHRLIDGKDSVQFLANIKHILENPVCLLLGV